MSARRVALFTSFAAALLLAGCTSTDDAVAPSGEPPGASVASTTTTIAGDQPDPCKVFSVDEVSRAVAMKVESGTPTGAGEGCSYQDPDKPTGTNVFLLSLTARDNAVKFEAAVDLARQSTPDVRVIPGVGDEAFAYAPTSGTLQSAEARKGALRVRVLLQGTQATPQRTVDLLRTAVDRV